MNKKTVCGNDGSFVVNAGVLAACWGGGGGSSISNSQPQLSGTVQVRGGSNQSK